jgi:hypothetical protein
MKTFILLKSTKKFRYCKLFSIYRNILAGLFILINIERRREVPIVRKEFSSAYICFCFCEKKMFSFLTKTARRYGRYRYPSSFPPYFSPNYRRYQITYFLIQISRHFYLSSLTYYFRFGDDDTAHILGVEVLQVVVDVADPFRFCHRVPVVRLEPQGQPVRPLKRSEVLCKGTARSLLATEIREVIS